MSERRDIVPEPLKSLLLYRISSTTSTMHWKDTMAKDKKLTREGTDEAKEACAEVLNDPTSSPQAKNEAVAEITRLERAFIAQEEEEAEAAEVEATEERNEVPAKPKPVVKPKAKTEVEKPKEEAKDKK